MAGIEAEFALCTGLVGFADEFGAVHPVVAGQVEFHIEHDAIMIMLVNGGQQALDILPG